MEQVQRVETKSDVGQIDDGRLTDGRLTDDRLTESTSDSVVELRHEAGLSAGQTMQLGIGRYEFGPAAGEAGGLQAGQPSVVSFEIEVIGAEEIILSPRGIEIKIDGRPTVSPETVSQGQVIQAGPDHFVVGKPDDFVSLARRPQPRITVPRVTGPEFGSAIPFSWLWLGLILLGILLAVLVASPWLLLALAGVGLAAYSWHRRRKQDNAEDLAHTRALERANNQLSKELAESRSRMSRQCRAAHLSPTNVVTGTEEIGSADDRSERTGRIHIAIGLGDVSWQPPVSERPRAGWDYQALVKEYSSLSAVPYLLDVEAGPLGLVGPNEATAAVARYLSHATESVSGKSLTVRSSTAANSSVSGSSSGRILYLAQDQADIPSECLHTVIVDDSGFASVQTRAGEVVATDLVPHGLPDLTIAPTTIYNRVDAAKAETSIAQPDRSAKSDQSKESVDTSADEILALASSSSDASLTTANSSGHFGGVQLYTSDSQIQSKELLAGIGLELAYRRSAARLSLTVLDSGDRGLVRLSQLPHCVGYAAIDDEENFGASIARLSEVLDHPSERLQVILASEFPRLIAFLQLSGRQTMADYLLDLARQTDQDRLVLVASATTGESESTTRQQPAGNITRSVSLLRESAL